MTTVSDLNEYDAMALQKKIQDAVENAISPDRIGGVDIAATDTDAALVISEPQLGQHFNVHETEICFILNVSIKYND